MRIQFVILFLGIMFSKISFSNNINGVEKDSLFIYILDDSSIIKFNFKLNKLEKKANFYNEHFYNNAIIKLAKLNGFYNDSQKSNIELLKKFKVVNLTLIDEKLLIGITYFHKNIYGKIYPKWGFIEFDKKLNLSNYYSIRNEGYLFLSPFHRLNISNIYYLISYNMKGHYIINELNFDSKKHIINLKNDNEVVFKQDKHKINLIIEKNYYSSPIRYILFSSKKKNYFINYPFPILFNANDSLEYIDPFNLIEDFKDVYLNKKKTLSTNDYSTRLIKNKYETEYVFLNSYSKNDSLFLLVRYFNDIFLCKVNMKTNKSEKSVIQINSHLNSCYFLQENFIYEIYFENNKLTVLRTMF